MSELPSYDLELKAAEERRMLHISMAELKSRVRENLDVKKQVRENLGLACSAAVFLGLTLGYSVSGLFIRH